MSASSKTLYEEFARFFEKPSRHSLRELLRNNVGEFANLDFKEQWPAFSKLARHLLGLANSGGGCIVVGMAEREDKTFEPKGLAALVDKAVLTGNVERFVPAKLLENLNISDFAFDASEYPSIVGKKFQVVFVEDDPKHLPFVATADGDGIRSDAIYVRRGAATEEAGYDELQRVINRRLDTGYSSEREFDLQTHFEQLKILYRQLDRYHIITTGGLAQMMTQVAASIQSMGGRSERIPNPSYPKEDLEAFVVRMIERKKKLIEQELCVVE